MRMLWVEPACPEVDVIWRPATWPTSALATLVVARFWISSDFITAAEPVKASFVVVPKATTMVSFRRLVSSSRTMLMTRRPFTGTCWLTKPMYVTESRPSEGALMEYRPSAPTMTPLLVPVTSTAAPSRGAPEGSADGISKAPVSFTFSIISPKESVGLLTLNFNVFP